MWYQYRGHRQDVHRIYYWRCGRAAEERLHGHVHMREDELLDEVGKQIADELRRPYDVQAHVREDRRPALQAELEELRARLRKYESAFEDGTLDKHRFADRTNELTALIQEKRDKIDGITVELARAVDRADLRTRLAAIADAFPHILKEDAPQQANATLRQIVDYIIVGLDKSIRVQMK
jgi:chromosome segregation ATPase